MNITMQEALATHKVIDHGHGHFSISGKGPVNPWTIHIYKDAVYPDTGTVWEWKVDGQYFDREDSAANYLTNLIAEKMTGKRVINRERGKIPDVCGCEEYVTKYSCWAKVRGYFTMLCSHCPIAEKMQADRDGVILIYLECNVSGMC